MPGSNGSQVIAKSVQVTDQEPQLIGSNVLPMTFFSADGVAPCWEDGDRDWWLRYFWRQFGNDLLQAFLAASVAKVVTQNFTIEGPEKKAEMYHRIIRDEFDFGKGYTHGLQRGVVDYYTQDNGWFIERLRSGPSDHAGPCLGLAHLDSQRMHPSGNDEFPYYYLDVGGEYHLMHKSQYIRIVDMPDSATLQYGDERGFCALSRALSTAMILSMLVTMKREKLSDLPPSAIAVFNNINRKQFENALTMHSLKEDHKGNVVWRSVMPLFGIDPAHPATLDFISFREVWEGFEERTAWDIAAYSFAAAWRMDVREVWPASQGPLGSGKEAEVQHQKAKSKSTGLLFTSIERSFNSANTLPADVNFKFQIQDAEEEAQKIAIHKEYIGNVKTMQDAGAALAPQEVRYLLIQQKILPRGFEIPLPEGEELDAGKTTVYIDDTEQQVMSSTKDFWGPTVIIDSYGVKTYVEQGYQYVVGSKGGPGSGFRGHAGMPGKRGGSAPKSSGFSILPGESFSDYQGRLIDLGLAGKISFEEATRLSSIAKPSMNIPAPRQKPVQDVVTPEVAVNVLGYDEHVLNAHEMLTTLEQDWLKQADPDAKFAIHDAFRATPELKDVRLYMMRDAVGSKLSFEEFKDTPVDVWRGGRPEFGETFATFTLSKGAAENFARNRDGNVYKASVKPSDLIGFAPTGATEVYLPEFTLDFEPIQFGVAYEVGSKEVLEMSKELYMLAGEKDDGETIFDKVAKLPPKERAKVRARARKLQEVMSADKRLEFLLTGIPDKEWDAAVQADTLVGGFK